MWRQHDAFLPIFCDGNTWLKLAISSRQTKQFEIINSPTHNSVTVIQKIPLKYKKHARFTGFKEGCVWRPTPSERISIIIFFFLFIITNHWCLKTNKQCILFGWNNKWFNYEYFVIVLSIPKYVTGNTFCEKLSYRWIQIQFKPIWMGKTITNKYFPWNRIIVLEQ